MIYIGIHEFTNGELWVEADEYEDREEAYEIMERNDSGLTVLSILEFEKIYNLLKEKEFFKLTKIEVSDKEYYEQKFKEWERARDKELGPDYFVKVVCDNCGKRFAITIRQTLPPCPECGGDMYDYETISVKV